MSPSDWLAFVAVWTAASLPLGPNAMNCIVTSLSSGFRRSLWSVGGVLLAAMCHMTAAWLGLSTLLLANAAVFQAVKWLGVAYLAWMGVRMLLKRDAIPRLRKQGTVSRLAALRGGFLTSITNPKAIFVYFAVLPQFIRPDNALLPQLLVLVPTALAIALAVYTGYAALGRGVGRLLSTVRRRLAFNYGVGGFYLLAAAGLSSFDPRRH